MIDILIPTFNRPDALAVTLLSLVWQTLPGLRIAVADQSPGGTSTKSGCVKAVARLLRAKGIPVEIFAGLPEKGIAANRDFLLSLSTGEFCLFLDDDLILEPDMAARLLSAMRKAVCGFVGAAPIGLSFSEDIRPGEQVIEFWEGPVRPERIRPGTREWERHKLHNAANIFHLQNNLKLTPGQQRLYKVAWIGSCVLYDTRKLRDCGGFGFWNRLPEEVCGEDVYAQIRVMERYGGCGIIPSGIYHQELTTTIANRRFNAVSLLGNP